MSRTEALVLAGHGSQRHPDSAAPLLAHADRIRAADRFEEVRAAFWREEPPLSAVRGGLTADVAFVVPVLTSEGYFADEVFPRELGLAERGAAEQRADDPSPRTGPELRYAEPVGTHDAVADVIADRVETAAEGPPEGVGVALVGHGTERHARSARATVEHARRLESLGRWADVAALFLDEPPHVGDLYDRLDAPELVVVPFFVADGYHATRDLPAAIDHPGVGEPATVRGRRVHCTRAVGTAPRLAEVIVERAVEAGARADAGPSGLAPPARAFRRWVDASASARTWGELAVSRREDGYELRHRGDAGRDGGALEELTEPAALRERVRTDDRGRYRPLAGARTLPSGWVLRELDPADLARAVRFVYPGTVADWWRGREGRLDATPFAETAARGTGDYADLDDVEGATLGAAVEAVCGDCARIPRWEGGAAGATPEPEEAAAIPCREACPFLRSALAELRDADALDPDRDGDPSVPVAAFDAPGNRYRVRFARSLARRGDDAPRRGSAAPAAPGGED